MLKREAKAIADRYFYNEWNIPDKMLYIERIMDGCRTEEQVMNICRWGEDVMDGYTSLIGRVCDKKYGTLAYVRITTKFINNTLKTISDLRKHTERTMKKLNSKVCRDCAFLTNVKDSEREKDNVMGGCFSTGHITTTDTKACDSFVENE